MPPDARVQTGTCAIVHRTTDNGLLMVRRAGTASYADGRGTWSVPGGWLDHGETPMRGACREVLEETGVTVAPAVELGWVTNPSGDGERTIVTLFVLCRYVGGTAKVTEPDKCAEVEWAIDPLDGRPLFTPLLRWIEKGHGL